VTLPTAPAFALLSLACALQPFARMNRSLLLAALLLVPALAAAETYTVIGAAAVDLESLSLSTSADADLVLEPLVIRARYGIRVEDSGQQFSSAVPIFIKTAYLVRDARGREYRFWVQAVEGNSRWIEVARGDDAQVGSGDGLFIESEFLMDGVKGRAMTRRLELKGDGTYSLNGEVGHYATFDRRVVLEGQEALKSGELNRGGSQISFRYQRAGVTFTVVMTRQTQLAAR
jgi:hypothetical protein